MSEAGKTETKVAPRFDLGTIDRQLDEEAIAASGWTHLPEFVQRADATGTPSRPSDGVPEEGSSWFPPPIPSSLLCKQCKKLPARWEKNGTCNCGKVHMNRLLCDGCMVLHLLGDAKDSKRVKTALIAALRKADPDIRSDEEAILRALHYEMHPRPEREPITEVE